MGAITYQPSSNESESSLFDIQEVAKNSIDIFEGATQDILPSLARAGGSAGGARPKVLVGISGNSMISGESSLPDGYDPWLIKFAAKQDLKTAGKMEYMYYRMAIDAGLEMTESKLFPVGENVFFGTKRFDRVEGQPVHMHSVANLIDADFRTPSLDYDDLMKITRILTKSNDDIKMMFRLMVFNIAIGNQDDHAKNFSFLMNNSGEWRLSPQGNRIKTSTDILI